METKNQEVMKFQKRMYDTIILSSFIIFIFTSVLPLIPKELGSLTPADQKLVLAITNNIFATVSLCSFIVCLVFFAMRPIEKMEKGEVLDGE